MSGIVAKKRMQHLICTALLLTITTVAFGFSSFSRHDPYPVYTTLDPHHFLNQREKLMLKGYEVERTNPERIRVAISPFGQTADFAKNMCKDRIEIGDLDGRWSMIGMLFGELPKGAVLPPSLAEARAKLFPTIPANVPIADTNAIDKDQQFGFFTVPVKYRKRGLRFELGTQIIGDFGIAVSTGVADMCQTVTCFKDLTCDAVSPNCPDPSGTSSSSLFDPCNPALTNDNVQKCLMRKLKIIADETCLDISNFHELSIEDVRLAMYWRHTYDVNEHRDESWPLFLITPYFQFEGTIATAKEKDPNEALGISAGNTDHDAVGFTGGINIDFAETIEVGAEAGFTHFFSRDICNFRMPNSTCQSGIYPFMTDVKYSPGHNWHFAAKMQAYHFMGHLSMYFQYVVVQHQDDEIELKKKDSAFHPEVLENRSTWKAQMANIGFNYDISPYISLGFLWQAPISQRNTYRSSTVMFSLNAVY